jgi:hypothetical protein
MTHQYAKTIRKKLRELAGLAQGKQGDGKRVPRILISALKRISAPKLMEANKKAFDIIVQGVEVEGDPAL